MSVPVGTSLWRHTAETGVLAGAAIFVTSLYGPHLGLATWEIALGYLVVGAATGIVSLMNTDSMALAAYLLGWGVFAAIWSTCAKFLSVWAPGLILGLTLFVFCMVLGGASIIGRMRAERDRVARRHKVLEAGAKQREFEDFLARIELPGISCEQIIQTRGGEDYCLRLPSHGRITYASLMAAVDRIETARNLRHGSVRISQGHRAAEAIVHITTKEVLRQELPYPMEDVALRSIHNPFPVGMYESGDLVMITFREAAGLVVGKRGSGKSNLLNVLIAQLALCVDCVIFMIDLKGGRAARPWLEAFVDEAVERPVLDWVATEREEAARMLNVLNLWIQERARSGGGREKIDPSPREPAIVLIVDEMAVIFGQGGGPMAGAEDTNYKLSQKGKQLITLGRSEAIDPIWATQRGTVTMVGDGDLKSQCDLRFALGAATAADVRTVLPDDVAAPKNLAKLSTIPGVAVIAHGETSAPLKIFRLDPRSDDIRQISIIGGRDKPEPEARLIQVAGADYTERWKRPAGRALIEQVAGRRPMPKDPDAEFEAIAANIQLNVDPRRLRMRELIRDKGLLGHSPGGLVLDLRKEFDEKDIIRETVQRWCSADADDGLLSVRNPGTKNVRYIWDGPPRLSLTGTDG